MNDTIPHGGFFKPNERQFENLCFIAIETIQEYLKWADKNNSFIKESIKTGTFPKSIVANMNNALKILLPYFDPYLMHKYGLGVQINKNKVFDDVTCLVYHALFIFGINNKVMDYEKGVLRYFNIVNNASNLLTGKNAKDIFL